MLQSETASASGGKLSQEEKDRALAEQLQRQLNCETPRRPPDSCSSLDEDDLYADNSYHLYEDGDQAHNNDEVIAAILQTDAIVPHARPVSEGGRTDLAIALELQQAEMSAVCMSDDYIAKEIASLEANTASDSVMAREMAEAEISNQLQVDEELARSLSLSQAETEDTEEHKQSRTSPECEQPMQHPTALANMMQVLRGPGHQQRQQHRRRQGRGWGGQGGHGAGRGQHQEEEVETDNYEDLLALEERIGDAEGKGLNADQLNMLPVSRYTSNSGGDKECKVCFSEFEPNERVRILPCCHLFHQDCIDNWIKDHNSCPICRKGIREELHH